MEEGPKVVGLNIGGHDGGCALLIGDKLRFAIAEERLNRYKYSPGWIASLDYCLRASGLTLADIDLFVFSSYGPPLPAGFDGGVTRLAATKATFISVDHHLSHAFGAYALSPFETALVIVMDGWGNDSDTESYYLAERRKIERIGGNDPYRSRAKGIGAAYEAFTNFLGFSDLEAGKTMGLSVYGDPQHFREPLFEISGVRAASRLSETHQWGVMEFARRNRLNLGEPFPDHSREIAWHIAAYVQGQTEGVVKQLVANLAESYQENVCLSGGVALNCIINTKLRKVLKDKRLFVLPFASDTGQPMGNALYGYFWLTGEIPKSSLDHCFFGRAYSDEEIESALRRLPGTVRFDKLLKSRFRYTRESDVADVAARLIAEGKIVAWFQGGSELGPRALGHRSIVADPRNGSMRQILNQRVKGREWFRPFAPSILAEAVATYFPETSLSAFMLDAPIVRDEKRQEILAALHVDGTARPHFVSNEQDRRFYRLISRFRELTGVPAVVNTSFNFREPIVETPGDALVTFLSTNLDYLVIGDYVVDKL